MSDDYEKEFHPGDSIEPILNRIGDWPCMVEHVWQQGYGRLDASMTLPYIDMEFAVAVAMDGETLIREPRPRRFVLWYEVEGLDDDSSRSRVFLARDQALCFFKILDEAVVRTYHNAECVLVENSADLAEEINADN